MSVTLVGAQRKPIGLLIHSLSMLAWGEIELSLSIVGRSLFAEMSPQRITCSRAGPESISDLPALPLRHGSDFTAFEASHSNVLLFDVDRAHSRRATVGSTMIDGAPTGNIYPFVQDWHAHGT